jgi:hypothetical protein
MNFYEISHLGFFLKFVDAIRFWLKSDKKKSKHFTRQPVYTFHISPCFFSVALRRNAGEGLLILEVSRSHTTAHTTVGRSLLDEWSARLRDHYLTTHNTHKRQIYMFPGWIWTRNLSRRAAVDLRLRPRGNWDRLSPWVLFIIRKDLVCSV